LKLLSEVEKEVRGKFVASLWVKVKRRKNKRNILIKKKL